MTPFQRRRNPCVNRMIQDMQIRNLAASTIDSHTWHVDKFCSHFGKMPDELGPEEIRQYQIFLVHEKKASWSSFNQCVCGLRFLYEVTLGTPWAIQHIPFGISNWYLGNSGSEMWRLYRAAVTLGYSNARSISATIIHVVEVRFVFQARRASISLAGGVNHRLVMDYGSVGPEGRHIHHGRIVPALQA